MVYLTLATLVRYFFHFENHSRFFFGCSCALLSSFDVWSLLLGTLCFVPFVFRVFSISVLLFVKVSFQFMSICNSNGKLQKKNVFVRSHMSQQKCVYVCALILLDTKKKQSAFFFSFLKCKFFSKWGLSRNIYMYVLYIYIFLLLLLSFRIQFR